MLLFLLAVLPKILLLKSWTTFMFPLLLNTKSLIMIMKKLLYFFNDLADDKKKKYVTMDIDKFVQQILIHLPPKNFKMINRFGFYGRNITAKLRNIVKKYKKTLSKSEYSFYVKQSIDTFGVHPFMCPYCKIMMDIQEIYVSSDWYGRDHT